MHARIIPDEDQDGCDTTQHEPRFQTPPGVNHLNTGSDYSRHSNGEMFAFVVATVMSAKELRCNEMHSPVLHDAVTCAAL